MKTKLVLAALFVAIATMGFECINDPITITLNLDPISGCWSVNTGNGSFNDTAGPFEIGNFIDPSFKGKIKKLRIYDIIVRASGPYPTGVVTGDGYFTFDNGTEHHLLHFSGQYSSYANGVSLLNPGGLVTYDQAGLAALISAIGNVNNLPQIVTLRGAGSGPAVTQNFDVCMDLKFQADANP